MAIIEFHPGPKLVALEFEGAKAERARDVTLRAAQYLFEPVKLKGATLADFFGLVELNPELRIVFWRDFIEDFLLEVKKGRREPHEADPEERIDYLELSWHWEFDSHTQSFDMPARPSLCGMGVVRTKDCEHYKKGERTHWGLMGSSVLEMLALEVRYNPQVTVTESDVCTRNYGQELQTPRLDLVTLGQALSGVFWELSFHGSPADAQKVAEELNVRISEVDGLIEQDQSDADDPPKSYSMHEVFGDLYKEKFAAAFVSSTVADFTLLDALRDLNDNEDACAALFAQFGVGSFIPKSECLGMSAIDLRRHIQKWIQSDDT